MSRTPLSECGRSADDDFPGEIDLLTTTIEQLQHHLRKGFISSVQLVKEYMVSIALRLKDLKRQAVELTRRIPIRNASMPTITRD
jgi:cobalamin-dependent methionine synthase I